MDKKCNVTKTKQGQLFGGEQRVTSLAYWNPKQKITKLFPNKLFFAWVFVSLLLFHHSPVPSSLTQRRSEIWLGLAGASWLLVRGLLSCQANRGRWSPVWCSTVTVGRWQRTIDLQLLARGAFSKEGQSAMSFVWNTFGKDGLLALFEFNGERQNKCEVSKTCQL